MPKNHTARKRVVRKEPRIVAKPKSPQKTIRTRSTTNTTTPFPITKKVAYHHVKPTPHKYISPKMGRILAGVGVGAACIGILALCNALTPEDAAIGNNGLPCPVPAIDSTGTPGTQGTPLASATPIQCTTNDGTHYVWVHGGGGWVRSNDGIHPNPGARGVGEEGGGGTRGGSGGGDDAGGHGGVGGGEGGSGHGGGGEGG
jgi:hypothetical protein